MPTLVQQFSEQLANAAERADALSAALKRSEQDNLLLRVENNALKAELDEHKSAQNVRQSGNKIHSQASTNPFATFGNSANSTNKGPESTPEYETPEFN